MIKENITLTMKEQNKIQTMSLVLDGQLVLDKALGILQCTERTFYRWKARLQEEGPSGLIHKSRGRQNINRTDAALINKILKLHQDYYYDANDSHFRDLLEEREKIKIGRSTLRRILRSHGVVSKRKRRPPKYRARRPRKESFGTMLQLDASHHQWLGPFGPWLALHGAIDDATNTAWAYFDEAETTHGYFELMRQVFTDKGLPLSLYTDRHSIFYPVVQKLSEEKQRRGEKSETQFGRAMRELGITVIPAYTPQAKGRIEKLWQFFQDRLVVEMRLAGIRTKEQAQEFLRGYLKRFNAKYSISPKLSVPVFRKSPRQTILDDILCRKEDRIVANDHTISYLGKTYQIPRPKGWRTLVKKTVEVWDRSDGIIKIALNGKILQTFKQMEYALNDIAA